MSGTNPSGAIGGMFYGSVRISSKGQIVIPQRVREEFGLKTGDQLIILGRPEQEGFALMKPDGFLRVQQELARMQAQIGQVQVDASIDGAASAAASEAAAGTASGVASVIGGSKESSSKA